MRIVDALRTRNHLTAAQDPNSQEQRQARHERHAARHAHAVVSMLNEIPRRELDFSPLGGRMIEHTESPDGDWYTVFGGDPAFSGDDVTNYYVDEAGQPVMLQRASNPGSRRELEHRQALKEQRRLEKANAANALNKQRRKTRR